MSLSLSVAKDVVRWCIKAKCLTVVSGQTCWILQFAATSIHFLLTGSSHKINSDYRLKHVFYFYLFSHLEWKDCWGLWWLSWRRVGVNSHSPCSCLSDWPTQSTLEPAAGVCPHRTGSSADAYSKVQKFYMEKWSNVGNADVKFAEFIGYVFHHFSWVWGSVCIFVQNAGEIN